MYPAFSQGHSANILVDTATARTERQGKHFGALLQPIINHGESSDPGSKHRQG